MEQSNRVKARQASTEKILMAAMRLFSKNGFHATSIRSIAEEAGISLGLMYNYFKSKDELLKEIIIRGFSQIKQSMQPYAEETDPREAIHRHISLSLEIARQNREFWLLVNSLRHQSDIIKKLAPEVEEVNSYILHTLEKCFSMLRYKNAAYEAYLLFAVIDGVINHFLMMGENYPAQQILEHLKSKYK